MVELASCDDFVLRLLCKLVPSPNSGLATTLKLYINKIYADHVDLYNDHVELFLRVVDLIAEASLMLAESSTADEIFEAVLAICEDARFTPPAP